MCPENAICEDLPGTYKCLCVHPDDYSGQLTLDCAKMNEAGGLQPNEKSTYLLIIVIIAILIILLMTLIFFIIKFKGFPRFLGRRFPYWSIANQDPGSVISDNDL